MTHALVHSGGGANGAWGLGVMKYMVEVLGYDWKIIVGTSVGALNGAGMVMYPLGQAREGLENLLGIWRDVTPGQIYKHWWPGGSVGDVFGLLFHDAIYNTKPVRAFVTKHFDKAKLKDSDRELVVAVVSLDRGELDYFDDQSEEVLEGILASSSYPVFFQPVQIGDEHYSDGGIVEIVPLQEAVERGATVVDVIICQPAKNGAWSAEGKSTLDTLPRMLGLMTTEIANDDLLELQTREEVEIRIWQPGKSVGSGLDFDQTKVQKLIQEGYEYAEKRAVELGLVPEEEGHESA